jgi:hypothetical protein
VSSVDIAFPFRIDPHGATATANYPDHVRQLIERVLFTTPGERVNHPDFGAGLLQLVFAPNSSELAMAVRLSAQASLQQWLGDVITVNDLEVTSVDSTITVQVSYTLLATGENVTDVLIGGA